MTVLPQKTDVIPAKAGISGNTACCSSFPNKSGRTIFICSVIRLYQLCLSPLFGTRCRFEPSCSAYAMEAIDGHGLGKGSWLAIKRLLRCHPFGSHGHDPVPASK